MKTTVQEVRRSRFVIQVAAAYGLISNNHENFCKSFKLSVENATHSPSIPISEEHLERLETFQLMPRHTKHFGKETGYSKAWEQKSGLAH